MVTITKYVWDTVSDCVLSELDENNAVTAVYTNEPQQYGGVLSQRRGTTSHYHHHDALGSTRFLTDSSGDVTDTYLHDAWGNTVASTGTTVNPFKWVGKYGYYTDDSTGQVYVRARVYQPAVARWSSVDPMWFIDGANLYLAYFIPKTIDPAGTTAKDSQSFTSDDDDNWYPKDFCKTACELFKKHFDPESGTVICYAGYHCPCWFGWYGAKPGDCPKLDEIVMEHEVSHIRNSRPCPDDCYDLSYSLIDSTRIDPIQEECNARNKTVWQLDELLKTEVDPKCQKAMDGIRKNLAFWLKEKNCLKEDPSKK